MLAFRDIYFRIILSIVVVIAAMLALQGGLNKLKLRALVAEATASQLQVLASTIEDTITRSERLGLAMSESAGATDLLNRLIKQNPDILQILVISPNGDPVLFAGEPLIDTNDQAALLRRVFGGRDKITMLDSGPLLYTSRRLRSSAGSVMGAVIVTMPTSKFTSQADESFGRLTSNYIWLLVAITACLIPFIIAQFSGIGRAYQLLNSTDPRATPADGNVDLAALQDLMTEGNSVFSHAETTLAQLETEHQAGTLK